MLMARRVGLPRVGLAVGVVFHQADRAVLYCLWSVLQCGWILVLVCTGLPVREGSHEGADGGEAQDAARHDGRLVDGGDFVAFIVLGRVGDDVLSWWDLGSAVGWRKRMLLR